VLGLFIGTVHLFVMLNAAVRSVAGKWLVGGVAAAVRIVLIMALSMAGARIRVGGAEPTPAITLALYGGPALTLLTLALAFFRRRSMPAGSETKAVADIVMRAWLAAAVFDMLFVIVNVARVLSAPR